MTPAISPLPLWIMLIYGLALLAVIPFCSQKITSLSSFFLANRKIDTLPMALTFVASWFGASSTMGSMDAFAQQGVSALWKVAIPSLLTCVVITLWIARRVNRLSSLTNSLSQPEAIEHVYGPVGRVLLAIVILAATTTFVGSQMVAAGLFFQSVLGIEMIWALVAITTVVLVYSSFGGYLAVVLTDMAQFGLLTAALLVLAGFVLLAPVASTSALQTMAGSQTSPIHFWDHLPLQLATTATFVLAWCTAPEMWQRMSSTPNEHKAFWGGVWATVLIAGLWGLVTLIGLYALPFIEPTSLNQTPVLVSLANQLPIGLTALVFVGFLAAVMSTMDSSLNVGSLTLTHDIYQRLLRPHASSQELLWVSRFALLIMAIPAGWIALKHQDILHVLWMSADIYASAMFFPIMGVLYLKNPGKLSGLLAMAFGGLSVVITTVVSTAASAEGNWLATTSMAGGIEALVQEPLLWLVAYWPKAPYSTLMGVSLSGLGFALGYWLERFRLKTSDVETCPQPEKPSAVPQSQA